MARIGYPVVTKTWEGMASTKQRTYGAGGYAPYIPPVLVPPLVSGVSPSIGTPLTHHQVVSFDVTDDGDFRAILLTASFDGAAAPEVVYDGTTFSDLYVTGSTTTAISGGFRFALIRAGGWPSAPTITPYAFDTTGQENP